LLTNQWGKRSPTPVPPFKPPLRPSATAAGSLSSGGVTGARPVAMSMIDLASWLSLGRLGWDMEPYLIHKQSLILYRLRRQARSDNDSIFWVDTRHSPNCRLDFGFGFAGHKIILDLFVPRAVENNCFRRPTKLCEYFCHSWNMRCKQFVLKRTNRIYAVISLPQSN
jgi:hypothetical protein